MGRYSRTRYEPDAGLNDNRRASGTVEDGRSEKAVTARGTAATLAVGVLALLIQASECAQLMCPPPDGVVIPGPVRRSTPPTGEPEGRRAPGTDPARAEGLKDAASSPAPAEPPRPEESAAPRESTTPRPGMPEGPPALDLTSLEKRLRETKAIGVFTKLSLKNQVDDLLEQLAAFHEGRGHTPLAKLRESYDLLLLKVLSLLQDKDPALARDIAASREALWNLLADPAKFANL